MKGRRRSCSKLKGTKGTGGLNVAHDPRLNFLLKRISLGQLAEIRCVLRLRQQRIDGVSGNFLIFIAEP